MAEPPKNSIAPLRSLDDFILESARFQMPNFNDLEKWNNRVIQNLLYYQSNYMLTYMIICILMSLLHPGEMFAGLFAVASASCLFFYLTTNKPAAFDFKKKHPFVSVVLILLCGSFTVFLADSMLIFILGVLLPLSVIFIHASMRMRNLRNKILNKVEWTGLKRSPMGTLLDFIGVEPDVAF